MDAVEFYMLDGSVRYRFNGEDYILNNHQREVIEFILEQLAKFFPDALNALNTEFAASKPNRWHYDFKRVDKFIRCNFSSYDTLSFDLQGELMNFEEVKCPLRGICKQEGIVCKPKFKIPMSKEESKAVALYSKGLTADEIGRALRKSAKTVKNQLDSARKRLHLNRTRDLIKLFNVYNITLWE